ncbi:MAG: hypothetical protein E6G97_18735 [Alphaproteobacteria bacterium]|nr:MAG: hypothetical protein E6G97_18735 [Alphaproteobacteria bacterium]
MKESTVSEKKQRPWSRLIAVARKAQAVIQAANTNPMHDEWDDVEAKQAFEDIECALADIEKTGLKTDELPALVEACQAGIKDYETYMDGKETYPEYHHAAINRISRALDKVTQP